MGDRLQANTPKESGGLVSLVLSHLSMFSCLCLFPLLLVNSSALKKTSLSLGELQ